jgi:hypothetical protein
MLSASSSNKSSPISQRPLMPQAASVAGESVPPFAQNKKTIIDNVADNQIRVSSSFSPPPLLSPTNFTTDML